MALYWLGTAGFIVSLASLLLLRRHPLHSLLLAVAGSVMGFTGYADAGLLYDYYDNYTAIAGVPREELPIHRDLGLAGGVIGVIGLSVGLLYVYASWLYWRKQRLPPL